MAYVVTRLMRYEYNTAEAALRDMEQWAVPPQGVRRFSSRETVRSTVIGPFADSGREDILPEPGLKEE